MTPPVTSFLDALKTAAAHAEASEVQYREQAVQRIAALERERAFAFRRLNFMGAVADAAAQSESEEIAIARVQALLRDRLGWETDSETRTQVLSHLAPVTEAVFRALTPSEDDSVSPVQDVLARFEAWYADHHPTSFWVLFDQDVPETPLVEF